MCHSTLSRCRGFSCIDLLMGLVATLFVGLLMLHTVSAASTANGKVKCARNLKTIGQGLLLYANDNNGNYPRTQYDIKKPTPTAYTGCVAKDPFFAPGDMAANDVTAPLYLLVRGDYVQVEGFVCPEGSAKPMQMGDKKFNDFCNFPGRAALDYSLQNPYAGADALADGFVWKNTIGADMAIAADMNPGGEVTKLTANDVGKALASENAQPATEQVQKINTLNHDRTGQNVLFGDGHVDWANNPFCGVDQDNIYSYGKSGKESGGKGVVGAPMLKGDSILLPTADDGKEKK